nr:MAG TPA: hypothetical protein [Caudoviricetes sp.]
MNQKLQLPMLQMRKVSLILLAIKDLLILEKLL